MSFPFVFFQECSQLLIMCSNYGWLKFIVDNVWTLISSMIKTSLINQYLGSKIDWHELLFSVLSSVHPWAEMLRLTGPAIKKKGQHTLRLVRQLFEYWLWWFVSLKLRKRSSVKKIFQVTQWPHDFPRIPKFHFVPVQLRGFTSEMDPSAHCFPAQHSMLLLLRRHPTLSVIATVSACFRLAY